MGMAAACREDDALPELAPEHWALIERADELGRGALARNATAVDRGRVPVTVNLKELVAAGLAGLNVPRTYGGHGVPRVVELRVLEGLAYGDGVTPFVIAQHFGTSLMLAASPNEALRDTMLPRMAAGTLLTGFGISHVRREGKPVLAVTPDGDGYRLDGAIPWITGYGLFDDVVIAGTLPDGQTLSAWIPLRDTAQLRIAAPLELTAMNAAMTVSAAVEGLRVRRDEVVAIGPNALRNRPNAPTVPCLFGLTRAGVEALAALAQRRGHTITAEAAARLRERLEGLRGPFYRLMGDGHGEDTAALSRARAAATRLALDTAMAVVVATGGGANALEHPAQRRLREVSLFATWGLSVEAVEVALPALSHDVSV